MQAMNNLRGLFTIDEDLKGLKNKRLIITIHIVRN